MMDFTPLYLSAKLALISTVILVLLAMPLAALLTFVRFPGRFLADSLVNLPLVLPPTVLGFYLLVIMGPNGVLGRAWSLFSEGPLVFTFAGITLAAQWGMTHDEALAMADDLYVTGNIFHDQKALNRLDSLPESCAQSGQILDQKRALYQRENIFPANIIDYVIRLLQTEEDESLQEQLVGIPPEERLTRLRAIMHRDLHRH